MESLRKQCMSKPMQPVAGNDPLDVFCVFPAELWAMIMDRLIEHPSDLDNLGNSNQLLRELVRERITRSRIQEVLTLLGHQFPKLFEKPCSKQPRVTTELLALRSLNSRMRNLIDEYTDKPIAFANLTKPFCPLNKCGFELEPYIFNPTPNKSLVLPNPISSDFLAIQGYPTREVPRAERHLFVSSFARFAHTYGRNFTVLRVVIEKTSLRLLFSLFGFIAHMPNVHTVHFMMEDTNLTFDKVLEQDKEIAKYTSRNARKHCRCGFLYCCCEASAFPRLPKLNKVIFDNCPLSVMKDVLRSNAGIEKLHIQERRAGSMSLHFKHFSLPTIKELKYTSFSGYSSFSFSDLHWQHIRVLHINQPCTSLDTLFKQLSRFGNSLEELVMDLEGVLESGKHSYLKLVNLKSLYMKIYSMKCNIDFISKCKSLENLKLVLFLREPYSHKERITLRSVSFRMYQSTIWKILPKLKELKIRRSTGHGDSTRSAPIGNISNGTLFNRLTYNEMVVLSNK